MNTKIQSRVYTFFRSLVAAIALMAVVFGVLALSLHLANPAHAAPAVPAGFTLREMPAGQSGGTLTDFVYTANGVYTTGKLGRVAFVSNAGQARTLAELPVFTRGDFGLMGITLAPDFPTSRQLYTTRTVPLATGQNVFRLSAWTVDDYNNPTALTAERTILELPASVNTDTLSHGIDTIIAAGDGSLWLSMGDNASFTSVDPIALRALDPNSGYGKLLHLLPDGQGVPSNPYYDSADPSSWRSRVFASGVRNPFRFSLDPTSGVPILGDVGWGTWEEINLVRAGSSYGWPCWEGTQPTNGYRDLAACNGVGNTAPLWAYNHNAAGADVIGGVVYNGTNYPEAYRGAYFFGDHVAQKIWTLQFDNAGNLTRPPEGAGFGTSLGGPVKFGNFGGDPSGDIVFADIFSSKLKRLVYMPGNRAPVARATTTTDPATRTVSFDASTSYDFDIETLTYAWDFGDGQTGSGVTATHTYAAPGTQPLNARLTVRDPAGLSDSTNFTVVPANNQPQLALDAPPAGQTYAVGESVQASALATDAEDGPLTVQWSTKLVHCVGFTCHDHPGEETTGPAYEQIFGDHGNATHLEVLVRATDSNGVSTEQSFVARPRLRNLHVTGNVPADISVNGQLTAESKITEGARVSIIAPILANDGVASFESWSDGAARERELTMPASDLALTASYLTPIDRRYRDDAAFRTILGSPAGPEIGDATLRYRDYTNGRAYWTKRSGVHLVYGSIMAKYLATGGHVKWGEPTTDQLRTPDRYGRYNHFYNTASIYWTRTTGAHVVANDIRAKWASMGWERGPCGYPRTDQIITADSAGRYNHFTKSCSIFWKADVGAHFVKGAIRERWASLGWEQSFLGYPTSDEFSIRHGKQSNFQFGYITWNATTGQVRVYRTN